MFILEKIIKKMYTVGKSDLYLPFPTQVTKNFKRKIFHDKFN